ncbi:hypothetical protein [uncultured Tateyamaria sp.]|uniref:hypothetical protein n=1 Tax=uncultured Tateyamaria sp. TaxID=455651 RepID=UPI0026227312|nr:hypothetical protein [uncultured Tateyamaria sp.]
MSQHDAMPIPTSLVLSRMANTLETLTCEMSKISQLVSELAKQSSLTLSGDQITRLQNMDRICQSLQDLSIISKSLATQSQEKLFSSENLRLAETRSILAPDDTDSVQPDSGSVELF